MLDTPKGLRLHIGLFGRRNVGKSSLMNALTGQAVSIVSDQAGTTTDPVEKALELAPLGPIVFVDTAGIDDEGQLGEQRIQRTFAVLERVDLAIIVCEPEGPGDFEEALITLLREQKTPFFVAFNKRDLAPPSEAALSRLAREGIESLAVSAFEARTLDRFKEMLLRHAPEAAIEDARLMGDLLAPGELALLVVPIDLGAPKGRLILPQVQAMRDILDSDASAMIVKERELRDALDRLKTPPRLVICDSQVVLKASADTPPEIALTTFSILMARLKGDFERFAEGAGAITRLKPGDRVLIAESCAHHPQADDIGRVKIPRWLRQYAGGAIETEIVAGRDFPEDLSPYSLIVQCGGCTMTRRQMLARQYRAASQGVPMSNYGMTISLVQGVLERTLAPFPAALAALKKSCA